MTCDPVQQAEFLITLAHELHWRRVPFCRADLVAFVQAIWPLVGDDPDVPHFAREFAEGQRQSRMLTQATGARRWRPASEELDLTADEERLLDQVWDERGES